jgi:hypothetical protein
MTTTSRPARTEPAAGQPPSLAAAGRFIDGLAVRDLDGVAATVADDVRFRAVLPRRILELEGRGAFRSTLDTWFGDAEHWELVEAVLGEVGGRAHLRWRLRVTKPVLGPGTFLVEQQVYADTGTDGTLRDVALLCSGFRPERS